MLHVIKKQIALLQEPLVNSVPNGEFADLKQRLSAIKTALKYTSSMMSSTNRVWIMQMQQQRQFSERFHEAYPSTHDDTYLIAKEFAEGSQNLYDKFARDGEKTNGTYIHIHGELRKYVKEIEDVEAEYSKLSAAKAETNRYQAKLDAMERSRTAPKKEKKQRNLQKMDTQREAYRALLKSVVQKQKQTYAKHPIMFKAALTGFWLNHEKHVTALIESLEKTAKFAKGAEEQMSKLDISRYQPERLERLCSIDSILMPSPSSEQRSASVAVAKEEMVILGPQTVDDIQVREGGNKVTAEFHDAVDGVLHDNKEEFVVSPITTPAVSPARNAAPVTDSKGTKSD